MSFEEDAAPVDDGPSQEAMNSWYEKYKARTDRPAVHVHFPTSLPECYVETRNRGCNEKPTLPKGDPWCQLRLGGVTFRMPIDDARLMIAAAAEAVEHAAWCVSDLEVDDY